MSKASNAQMVSPRFETGKPILIAGLKTRYSQQTRAEIPAHWHGFVPYIGQVPDQVNGVAYGVCWNFDSDGNFDYLTGVEVSRVSDLAPGFSHVMVPGSRYAVFTHSEHASALPNTIQAIWCDWRPTSGREIADSPSFERYGEKFDPQTGTGDIEIWVPVKE
ncbi:MAG: AraC family transcriptional regulator [Candidatus Hydrogenedentes bacterium]|nr:AraC family transcriptional regulator [Candidatus Hydrogenedentota bacterium]